MSLPPSKLTCAEPVTPTAARERVVAVEAGRDEPVDRLVAGDPRLRGETADDEPAGRVVASA